jgi:predicted metal-dependent hydrolase
VEKAKSVFKHKIDEYSKKLGVKVEGIAIKHLKNRWYIMTKKVQLI